MMCNETQALLSVEAVRKGLIPGCFQDDTSNTPKRAEE